MSEDLKDDWKYEVTNGDTLLGFEEWKQHKIEAEKNRKVEPTRVSYSPGCTKCRTSQFALFQLEESRGLQHIRMTCLMCGFSFGLRHALITQMSFGADQTIVEKIESDAVIEIIPIAVRNGVFHRAKMPHDDVNCEICPCAERSTKTYYCLHMARRMSELRCHRPNCPDITMKNHDQFWRALEPDTCDKCGSDLIPTGPRKGYCKDQTCPYSDHKQGETWKEE